MRCAQRQPAARRHLFRLPAMFPSQKTSTRFSWFQKHPASTPTLKPRARARHTHTHTHTCHKCTHAHTPSLPPPPPMFRSGCAGVGVGVEGTGDRGLALMPMLSKKRGLSAQGAGRLLHAWRAVKRSSTRRMSRVSSASATLRRERTMRTSGREWEVNRATATSGGAGPVMTTDSVQARIGNHLHSAKFAQSGTPFRSGA